MIEEIVLTYLSEKLDVPCVMENIEETEYVLISKTGSGLSDHIKSATITIQSYSDSLYKAAVLNEAVKNVLLGDDSNNGIVEVKEVSNITLNSDYEYSDTTTKVYRYQAVFDLVHY